jgi:hypothetical protein
VHVHGATFRHTGVAPDVLEQALPREHLSRVFEEVPQQNEFPCGQLERLTVACDHTRVQVDHDATETGDTASRG